MSAMRDGERKREKKPREMGAVRAKKDVMKKDKTNLIDYR